MATTSPSTRQPISVPIHTCHDPSSSRTITYHLELPSVGSREPSSTSTGSRETEGPEPSPPTDTHSHAPLALFQTAHPSNEDHYTHGRSIPSIAPGTLFFRYRSVDDAEVKYYFDPGAENGSQYVVGVYREPESRKRALLEGEKLAMARDELDRLLGAAVDARTDGTDWEESMLEGRKRRDSVMDWTG